MYRSPLSVGSCITEPSLYNQMFGFCASTFLLLGTSLPKLVTTPIEYSRIFFWHSSIKPKSLHLFVVLPVSQRELEIHQDWGLRRPTLPLYQLFLTSSDRNSTLKRSWEIFFSIFEKISPLHRTLEIHDKKYKEPKDRLHSDARVSPSLFFVLHPLISFTSRESRKSERFSGYD